MNEPFRLRPVIVVLGAYRTAALAAAETLSSAWSIAAPVVRREARHLLARARRALRPKPEVMPSLIGDRIRAVKGR